MKNLFKHIIGPYLILWVIQILVLLFTMLFFDHVSNRGAGLTLSALTIIIFIFLNILLCDRLVGLFSKRSEQFDARYPGKQWNINFFRYIWPVISVVMPYILVLPVYSSGLYWHIQERYFLWIAIPDSAYYLTKENLIFITKIVSLLSFLSSCSMLLAAYNYKQKSSIFGRIVLWFLFVFFLMHALKSIFFYSQTSYISVVLIAGMVISFLWLTFLKPRRPVSPYKRANINYYLFVGLIISQFIILFNYNGFSFPLNYYIAFVLFCISFYKAGFAAALIGATCGLNVWSAVWIIFILPDSFLCKCKSCGKYTFSFYKICSGCKKNLAYDTNSLFFILKKRLRPGAIGFIAFTIIFISAYIIGNYIDSHKKIITKEKNVTVIAPYKYSNVVIRLYGDIIGTNFATLNSRISIPALTNSLSYEINGNKIDVADYLKAREMKAYVTGPEVQDKTEQILNKIYLADFDIGKISKKTKIRNDSEAIDLISKAKRRKNKSLYKCCEVLISNYWFSLTEKQRRNRFDYYLQIPKQIYNNNYYYYGPFTDLLLKNANPEWFKQTPVISDQKDLVKIYSESEIKEILFSKKYQELIFYKFPESNSKVIKYICSQMKVRNLMIYYKIPEPVVLPYLRRELQKLINGNKTKKIMSTYKTRLLLRILINNPDLVTQEDIQIIKKAWEIDINLNKCSRHSGLVIALDKPELWDFIGKQKNLRFSENDSNNKFFPREFKSTNAFDVCCKLDKENTSLAYSHIFVNLFSRIKIEKAIDKVLKRLPGELLFVAGSDAINRVKIMQKFTKQNTKFQNFIAEMTCRYPYPGAKKALKSIRDKCSAEDKIKIDAFLQDD